MYVHTHTLHITFTQQNFQNYINNKIVHFVPTFALVPIAPSIGLHMLWTAIVRQLDVDGTFHFLCIIPKADENPINLIKSQCAHNRMRKP